MAQTMEQRLPDWTATAAAGGSVEVSDLIRSASEFVQKSADERAGWVQDFAARFCMPFISFPEASGLYLLLRTTFALPEKHPRDATKVFGGWLHPSVKAGSGPFDLSWPVHVRGGRLIVERFRGYAKGPYDASGEYQYFAGSFPLRSPEELQRLAGGDFPLV